MALTKCFECGKEMSDSAKSCPSCGAENIENKSVLWDIGKVFLFFLIIYIVIDVMRGYPMLHSIINSFPTKILLIK